MCFVKIISFWIEAWTDSKLFWSILPMEMVVYYWLVKMEIKKLNNNSMFFHVSCFWLIYIISIARIFGLKLFFKINKTISGLGCDCKGNVFYLWSSVLNRRFQGICREASLTTWLLIAQNNIGELYCISIL